MKSLEDWLSQDVAPLQKMGEDEVYDHLFFRNPNKPITINPKLFYSPANGIVMHVKRVNPHQDLVEIKGRHFTLNNMFESNMPDIDYLVISVFMTQYDVHYNRMPTSGIIKHYKLPPIQSHNVSMVGEENDILHGVVDNLNREYLFYNERAVNHIISAQSKIDYYMIQIADKEVNMIEPFFEDGQFIIQGHRMGMIKHGSQVTVVIPNPPPVKVLVQKSLHIESGIDPLFSF